MAALLLRWLEQLAKRIQVVRIWGPIFVMVTSAPNPDPDILDSQSFHSSQGGLTAKVQGTSVGCTCLVDWISCGNADPCASLPLRASNI
ncbi:hypothetical protein P8452_03970 [Trifolium repens]|nr:hypothetical protein P8452_03970 [Trifolium repens]